MMAYGVLDVKGYLPSWPFVSRRSRSLPPTVKTRF